MAGAMAHHDDTVLSGDNSSQTIDVRDTTLTGIDHIDAGAGNDTVIGSQGDDTVIGGAGNDRAYGGDGSDIYEFDPFEGNDYFHGGDGGVGWADVIQLDATADTDAGDNPWTIEVDGVQVEYDLAAQALELAPDTSGVVTMSDGSELIFDGVEKIEW